MNHEHHLDHRPAPAAAAGGTAPMPGPFRRDAGPAAPSSRWSWTTPRAALAVPHLLGVHPAPDTLVLVGLRRRCPEIIVTAPVQVLGTDPGAMAAPDLQ